MKRLPKTLLPALLISTLLTGTAAASTRYVNSKNGLMVRNKPDEEAETITILSYGTKVQLLDDWKYGRWYRIKYEDGDAFISADYTQKTDPLDDMTYMGTWRITAYAYTGSPCANGNFPQTDYTIACNSLPFGTEVYIDGVGFRTVEDRGPAWLGSEWLDIYMGDTNQCIQWGDQYRDVYIVPES